MPSVDGITISLADDGVFARLDELRGRVSNLQPVLEDIGAAVERNVDTRFDTKQDPSGRAWAPLAPSTRARYDRQDLGVGKGGQPEVRRRGTLLERTGLMRQSLSHQATPLGVEIGFGREPAAYHEFGTKRMPRRGLLTASPDTGELGAEDRSDVIALLEAYLAP